MPHDVFISHSAKDKAVADAVCHGLEARGIRCWIAPRDVTPGRPFAAEIMGAIRECRVLVLIFSGAANQSAHVQREVTAALDAGATVAPVRIENVRAGEVLDYYLAGVHWLDALDEPLERHVARLAEALKPILASADGGPNRAQRTRESPPPPPPPPPPRRGLHPALLVVGGLIALAIVALTLVAVLGRDDDRRGLVTAAGSGVAVDLPPRLRDASEAGCERPLGISRAGGANVYAGPGNQYPIIDRIPTGSVSNMLCERRPGWLGVVYVTDGGAPNPRCLRGVRPGPYTGPCRQGWISEAEG